MIQSICSNQKKGIGSSVFLQRQVEQFYHQAKFSDGEIYRKIRYYQQRSEEDLVQDWKIRLTEGKEDNVSRLLKKKLLVKAFDMLLPFPGLWSGLQLGNIRSLLALHCDEEIFCYLEHTYRTWNRITLQNTAIQKAVDIDTVRKLHLRAPSASSVDRRFIIDEMDNGALFPAITDAAQRGAIKQSLLALDVIIPTIESLHDNLKYLNIGASIIKARLLKEGVETKVYKRTTVYKFMRSHWSAPETIREEFREGEFRDVTFQDRNAAAHFCYTQVFMAALRQFQSLSDHTPLLEPKRKRGDDHNPVNDSAYRVLFLDRAQRLGFGTEKIDDGVRNAVDPVLEAVESITDDYNGQIIGRRSGIPRANAYKELRTQLFLTNLSQVQAGWNLNPSVLYVQRDFLNAFFGCISDSRRYVVPSTAPTPLSEPAAPPALPHRVLGYQPEAAAASDLAVQAEIPTNRPDTVASPEQTAFVERQTGAPTNSSPRELVASPRTISSQYTQVMSPELSAYSNPSRGMEETWSQFSLPNLDESYSERESNGPQNQGEQSFTSISNDRRSFPTSQLRDYERRSYTADLHDTNVWCSTSIDGLDRRSFPELESLRDKRQLSAGHEPTNEEDERRSTDNGSQSFPELEARDGYMQEERRSFPTNLQRTGILSLVSTDGSRSFPELDF